MLKRLTCVSTTILLCAGSLAAQTPVPYFSDFEANNGGFTGTFDWQWGTPTGVVGTSLPGGYGGAEPTGGFSGTNCWGTILGGLHSASTTSVLSQTFDFTGSTNTLLLFQEWIDSGGNTFDTAEVFVNGTQLYLSDGGPTTWRRVILDLSAYDGQTNVQVDFTFTTTSVVERVGWYIDDFTIGSGVIATGTARGTGCPAATNPSGDFVFQYFSGNAGTDPNDIIGQSIYYQRQMDGSYLAVLGPLAWVSGYANRIDNVAGIWNDTTNPGDDSVTFAQPLGFTATFGDTVATDAYVCSNGRVYVGAPGSESLSFTPTTLRAGPFCIALWSDDLNLYPAGTYPLPPGTGLYVDQIAGELVITFDVVPVYGSLGSTQWLKGQVRLQPDGSIISSIDPGTTIDGFHGVGFFRGNGSGSLSTTTDETDLSVAMAPPGLPLVVTPGTTPMLHDAELAVLGTTPQARANDLPPGTLAAVLHVGLDQTSLALDVIGMTNCTAYTLTLTAVLPMNLGTANDASVSMGLVPNDPALLGGILSTPADALSPGVNPLQLISSNGWDWVIGDL